MLNVASSTDLGILLSDILNMVVTKSELGGEMFDEQFRMFFLVIIVCTTFYYMCCIVFSEAAAQMCS